MHAAFSMPRLKLFKEFIHRFVERNGVVVSDEMIALDEHQFSIGQAAVDKLGVSAFDQILRAHNNQGGSLNLGKLLRVDGRLLCHKAQVFITRMFSALSSLV